MNVVVVGPGAIGCLFGARLALSGNEVFMLDRDASRAALIEDDGLVVDGMRRLTVEVRAGAEPAHAPAATLALVCVKSYDTPSAAEAVAGLPGRPYVLTLQNGLGNAEELARAVGPSRVGVAATSCGATKLGPGRIRQAGEGPTELAPWSAEGEAGARLAADALRGAGFDVYISADPMAVLWRKLVVNAAVNGPSAIAGVPNGKLATLDHYRVLLLSCAREAAAVAEAAGVHIDDPEGAVLSVCEDTADNVSSMLQDVRRGARTEVDAIYGAVVRRGAELGVETPVTEEMLRAVKALEQKEREKVKEAGG